MALKISPVSVQNSCDIVLRSFRESSLNFSMQETPFSIYISVRKSFFKHKDPYVKQDVPSELLDNLKISASLQQKLDEATKDYQISLETIEKLQKEIQNHEIVQNKKDVVIEQLKRQC